MSSLSLLPFDILHQVASQLDVLSYDRLSKTSRSLHDQLRDEHTARNTVHASILHSPWTQLALSAPDGSFRTTIDRVSLCNDAFQTALPYSVSVVGHATSFSYHGGIVCYTTSSQLRILDLNHRPTSEKVFGHAFFRSFLASPKRGAITVELECFRSLQLQGYADNVAVLTCHLGVYGPHLFAVNISEDFNESSRATNNVRRSRIVFSTPLVSNKKLFVTHNSRHIVWGTHSATGDEGHREWLLYRHELATPDVPSKEPLQLRNFYGSEIGSTASFTIHENYFYAVTNQTSFETEEVDWTSYYHVVKFHLDLVDPDVVPRMVWRRQHLEGPINDAWTDLGFQVDHCTGELLIVECRKEWVDGGSRCVRTYYSQPLQRAVLLDAHAILRAPPDDPLRRTLDEKNKSHYEDSHVRIERYVHSEYARHGGDCGEDARDRKKEYLRAKTKWNGYDFNRQCFVDVVSEEVTDEGSWRPRERLRVRVVSRKGIGPLVLDDEGDHGRGNEQHEVMQKSGSKYYRVRSRVKDKDGLDLRDGEEKFTPSEIVLWPRGGVEVPRDLEDVLCPGGKAGEVKAVLGYEGIVYLSGPADLTKGGERALVFVCFDPTFGFDGMRRVDGSMVAQRGGGSGKAVGKGGEGRGDSGKKRKNESVTSVVVAADGGGTSMVGHGLVVERAKRVKNENGTESDEAGFRGVDERRQYTTSVPRMSVTSSSSASLIMGALDDGPPFVTATSTPTRTPDLSRDGGGDVITSGDGNIKTKSKSTAAATTTASGTTRSTWRERAAHISIGKGFWLR
ncbi:uncharacterized protein PV06_07168 [Exophiala oligosperma]|uniref:F-box domain-containing protein n=1 Tax=Exophiala oligosperma TaxID=215243 RepID=A0A0D2E1F8_9EURO|nr:uncharacterized protein PV06_07168 [Exophiala oligosperma]KIW41629.1 hypothetical protein PV06_07168 [Exophiala oligosperma]